MGGPVELWEGKGGFRLALMGRLNTGHVSACARELDLIDLPDSGLAAKENHLSNVCTSWNIPNTTTEKSFFFQAKACKRRAVTLITVRRLLMLTHNADASPKLRMILLG